MKKLFSTLLVFLPFWLLAQNDTLGAQLNNQNDFQVFITQATKPIVVDGVLDEHDWAVAKPAKDFWMKYPDNKRRADTKTEVRLTYDDHNLYIGAICYDSSAKHVIPTLKRDVNYFDGDGIAIVLDPVNRMSNAYLFGVSPLGVQSEAAVQFFGDPVWSWDTKWFSQVKQYADRWTVEIAIPFKSLRYEKGQTTWGINFIRNDIKHGQYQTWARVPVQFFGYSLGYYGSLEWEWAPPVEESNVVLIPYLLGGASKNFETKAKTENILRGGADAKIALNSQLNLDATINPDFSQVDVDEQVTNLTRFNIFFPEKRTFFLENSDVLSELGSPMSRPFFSRRIGLDANGQRVPIQFGARLSGNLNKTLRVNAFDMQTAATPGQKSYNYFAGALQQALTGRSFVKVAAMNRQDMTNFKHGPTPYIRELSSEISFTSKNNLWDAWGLAHHSMQPKVTKDNNFFETGIWYHNDRWQLLLDYVDLGTNYQTGMEFFGRFESHDDLLDTTFRVGYKQGFVQVNYNYIPKKSSVLAQNRLEVRNINVWNPNGSFNNRLIEIENTIRFNNTAQIVVLASNEDNQLPVNIAFTEFRPLPPGRYKFTSSSVAFTSDIRRRFYFNIKTTVGEFYNGKQLSVIAGINYRQTPWGLFGLRFERYDLQFPEPHKQSLLYLINGKAEFSFTKNLIWTTFLQYNTQADNFNINSRLQWRYKPMSDVFIVYTDNYAAQPFLKKNRGLVCKVNYWLNL